jgi:predicted transposase YbfD/YdcC
MGMLTRLRDEFVLVEKVSEHEGYLHCVSNTLLVLVLGMLCGLQRIDDIHEWAKSKPTGAFLNKWFSIEIIPCRAQIYNILKIVNVKQFKESFINWMQVFVKEILPGNTVSIDGKTVCGTDKLTKDGSILNVISAYASELKLVIGSHECNSKPGERAAFRELLNLIDIKDTIVVADALHCNQPSVKAIINAEADYLLVVKANSRSLHSNIETYFAETQALSAATTEINGGRHEVRTAFVCTDIEWLPGKEKWLNISCVGAIRREFTKNDETTRYTHYYISSAPLTPEKLLHHARMEWGIESMHWLLDVHYNEDKTRVRDMNVQKILNIIRKSALNMIRTYRDANHNHRTPLTSVMKNNLFDLDVLGDFIEFFRLSSN